MTARRIAYQQSPFPPEAWPFGLALALIIVIYFLVSNLALNAIGLNYEDAGGNPLEKIHPATFLACLTLAVAGLTRRKPLEDAFNALMSAPGATLLVLCALFLMFHSIFVSNLPFTQLIDALVAPVVAFFLFRSLTQDRARRLSYLIHALFFANSLLAIAEYTLGFRLTPLVAIGTELSADWRSSAFFGHPLANASLTATYLLAMAIGAGRDLPFPFRLAAVTASMVAMIAFGGRVATVLLVLFVTVAAMARLAAMARGGGFSRATLLAWLLMIPVIALIVMFAANSGFLDQFLSRFSDDDGSAATRLDMLELFRYVPWHELLFAPDPALITSLRSTYRLDFGIESFWIAFIFTYGIVPSLPLFGALLLFGRDVVRASGPKALWLALLVLAVASASTSLSSKTTVLTTSVILTLTFLRAGGPALTGQTNTGFSTPDVQRRSNMRHRTC